jgi:hypothetical protein
MSASGGMAPALTKLTSRWAEMRPHPLIWSHPAVVTKRCESGSDVKKLLAGPGGFGVEKSMSSAAARNSCLASSADSGRPDASGEMMPCSTAFRASEYSSPAMPDDWPVASEEHEFDSTETQV